MRVATKISQKGTSVKGHCCFLIGNLHAPVCVANTAKTVHRRDAETPGNSLFCGFRLVSAATLARRNLANTASHHWAGPASLAEHAPRSRILFLDLPVLRR